MEKLLLRCYAVLLALFVLFIVGCSDHETQGQGIERVEQSTVTGILTERNYPLQSQK